MEIPLTWDAWKKSLAAALGTAEFFGLSEAKIKDLAHHLGNFLASKVEPATPEHRLLKNFGTRERSNKGKRGRAC